MTEPNPALIWDTINAHQRTAALRAAVDLNIFAAIGDGVSTASALAARCGAPERGVRILCDYLAIIGLLAKNDGLYAHTPSSAVFLDPKSPASWHTMLEFMNTPKILDAFRGLTETVRRGKTVLEEPVAGEEVKEWVQFARAMRPLMMAPAEFLADIALRDGKPKRVLDVAASHGAFGLAIARREPEAHIYAQDYPNVLVVSQENATAAGVADRYHLVPGNAFTAELGAGYDVVLVTNLFHHFNRADCESLMRRFHACMAPGGRMLTLEFVPNPDRVTPPLAASFSLMMLGNTPDGDAYTMDEYSAMLDAAGFRRREIMDVPQSPQQLIVAYG